MHAFFLARVENVTKTNVQTHIGGWVENVTNGRMKGGKGDGWTNLLTN